jgi:hypothetical protein
MTLYGMLKSGVGRFISKVSVCNRMKVLLCSMFVVDLQICKCKNIMSMQKLESKTMLKLVKVQSSRKIG